MDGYKEHLVIIGGGSAAFSAAIKAHELGARVTLINDGLPIGGCCVNVGCVPSKTLIRAGEAHHRANINRFEGIVSQSRVTDFSQIMRQKTELVFAMRQEKYLDVVSDLADFRAIDGHGRLAGANRVEVNGETLEADKILIATGTTTHVPAIPGLESAGYLTHESAFELRELPPSMIVLGGRFIALECAQLFARLGTRVTLLQRSSRILPTEAPDITRALTGYFSEEGIEVVTGVAIREVSGDDRRVIVAATVGASNKTLHAAHLLVATGRGPNTRNMGLEANGVELDPQGYIKVGPTLETAAGGVYAAGDVIGEKQFVYSAAYEGGLVAGNCFSGTTQERDYTALPWVVFTDPQVAGVGLDEYRAAEKGIEAEVSVLPLTHVPRAIAARDTRGFIKLIRNKKTDHLLGARILAPEGSELLMEVSLAIKYGIPAKALASAFHPYLTLGEGIKLAAIAFGKDIKKLSCCAS